MSGGKSSVRDNAKTHAHTRTEQRHRVTGQLEVLLEEWRAFLFSLEFLYIENCTAASFF